MREEKRENIKKNKIKLKKNKLKKIKSIDRSSDKISYRNFIKLT